MKLTKIKTDNFPGKTTYAGIKDAYNHNCTLVVDPDLKEYRLMGKNPDYRRKRKFLDDRRLNHISVPEYLEVIDITQQTAKFLFNTFPDYRHTQFQIW